MSQRATDPQTDEDFETDTELETDTEPQTPATNAHARAVANRPKTRQIQRWNDAILARIFAAFRKHCSEMGLDWKPALEAAIKDVIDVECTVDALAQQLVKRAAKFDNDQIANGSVQSKSTPSKTRTPAQTKPLRTAEKKASNSKVMSRATKPSRKSVATPATLKRDIARAKKATDLNNSARKRAKADQEPITPVTPSRTHEESDSEYVESHGKTSKKRVRRAVTKVALETGRKKASKQLSNFESDFEDETIGTPSKKSSSKGGSSSAVKNSGLERATVQPAFARKAFPAATATVEVVQPVEQPEFDEDDRDEKPNIWKIPRTPAHEMDFLPHAIAPYEGSSRHDSFNDSPPWPQEYDGNSMGDLSYPDILSYGQSLDSDNSFGDLLGGDYQPATYYDHFGPSNLGVSTGGSYGMVPSATEFTNTSQDSDHQSMLHKPSKVYYDTPSLEARRSRDSGGLTHGNNDHNPASFYQARDLSFSTNDGEEARSFGEFLSGQNRSSFFDGSSESIGDHDYYSHIDSHNFEYC
ncbi:hypothetical protein FKW77_007101 [Venturia effusa]|uniref:Uncharacterized protein n=1 Tax=Venturia effusa TaxID=50376 RepID=A0A517L3M3_9PEZI|nr:hypothetical protein FKW77_007101 [Venturia effusa]